MAPYWSTLYKTWTYQGELDPIRRREIKKEIEGAGVTVPDAIQDIRQSGEYSGGNRGVIRLRDSNDFIDLSSVTNRQSRYKEYERLRVVPEIENAITIFADEACVIGKTLVATPFGYIPIKELADTKKPGEKFLVYCYDFGKQDYTLGWAHTPRLTKHAKTVVVTTDDGMRFECTPDHRVLLRNGEWIEAGKLKTGSEIMPFYRVRPEQELTKSKKRQYPRIFTFNKGWVRERDFIDAWKTGKSSASQEKFYKIARCIAGGLTCRQTVEVVKTAWQTIDYKLKTEGFSYKELQMLGTKPDRRRVLAVWEGEEQDVYDLSVDGHENFCTDTGVFHNCQLGENGHMLDIQCKNQDIKQELEFLFFHPTMLNVDDNLWGWCRDLFLFGDHFMELVIDPDEPKLGVLKVQVLPPESMYRIETIKTKVVEFQQAKDGPDYQSLAKVDVRHASEADLAQATALRFAPESIVHFRIGGNRKTFYPYGVSLIEAARGPAHQLKMMEDAMLIYRLIRAPERRVFYIDVGQLPPFKAEAFMMRLQDQFRKKKTFSSRSSMQTGASPVEERWQAPSSDEDFWIPMRPNSNTRVETLPGACLALDTRIPLLDGRNIELSEIIKEYESGKQLWAYSIDPKTGASAPGKITWAGITRKNAEVVKVNFDNGESIICTPDHKFPTQNRGKIEAKELKIGDSLFPFKKEMKSITNKGVTKYEQIYDSHLRKWIFTHRMVAKFVASTIYENRYCYNKAYEERAKKTVHHKDFNNVNNTPENLTWMNSFDHFKLHSDNIEQLKKYLKARQENIEINNEFRLRQREGWKKAREVRPELHAERGKKISERNRIYWCDPKNKEAAFVKQRIVFPENVWKLLTEHLKNDGKQEEFLDMLNKNINLLNQIKEANQHIKRANVNLLKGVTECHLKRIVQDRGFKTLNQLKMHTKGAAVINNESASEVVWPNDLWNFFLDRIENGDSAEEALAVLNEQSELLKLFAQVNARNFGKDFRFKGKLTMFYIKQMVRAKGYRDTRHLKKEAKNYNHKVTSVEVLSDKIDVGTLTIDGKHELHNYHTFATMSVFTFNSNLSEIDDALYFRNKLFISMCFPKNYMAQDDPAVTKMTISSMDVKFARLVERLQRNVSAGLIEIATRHLQLRGFPAQLYDDLQIKMTAPSHYREISENEVKEARVQRLATLKGTMVFSDLDLMVDEMKIPMEIAKEKVARAMIQKLQELKLQVMSQNPQLLGIATPGPDGNEMGMQPGGPMPQDMQGMGGADGAQGTPPPPGGELPAEQGPQPGAGAADTYGQPPPPPQGAKLATPSEDDIRKYDMDIEDFSRGIDDEEVDELEIDEI